MNRKLSNYVLLFVLAIVGITSYFISKPFLTAILASVILAYMFSPVYLFFQKYIKNKSLASITTVTLVFLSFIIPIILIIYLLMGQLQVVLSNSKGIVTASQNMLQCSSDSFWCEALHHIQSFFSDPTIQTKVIDIVGGAAKYFLNIIGRFFASIPSFILMLFVAFFLLYYLFKDSESIIAYLRKLSPLKSSRTEILFSKTRKAMQTVLYGYVYVAAIQSIILGLAFWIFGVPVPFLWTFVMFILSLLPVVGAPMIWIPAVLIKFFSGHESQAIGLLTVGIFASLVDNFLRPKLMSGKDTIHPAIVLIGTLGGLAVFGIVGIIIGPIILFLFFELIDDYFL